MNIRGELDKMDVDALKEIQGVITTLLSTKEAEKQEAFRSKIEEMANSEGVDLAEILGLHQPKVAAKYRNPKNADETWSGRGRKPKWVEEAVKLGNKLTDFEIKTTPPVAVAAVQTTVASPVQQEPSKKGGSNKKERVTA